MAIRVETGLPDLLYELGSEIHDLTLADSADGDRITRAWAVRALDRAQQDVFRRLLRDKIDPQALNPKQYTLVVDPNDSDRFKLPRRARQVLYIKDTNDAYYASLDSAERGSAGFWYQGSAIEFTESTSPTAPLTAHVVCAPLPLSYGTTDNSGTTTSLILASSPTIGENVLEDDAYVGARIALESGTYAGEIQRVTAFTESTRACTVNAFSAYTAGTDTYTTLMDLPAVMKTAVVRRAAVILMRADEGLSTASGPKGLQMLQADYETAYREGVVALQRGVHGHVQVVRRGTWDPFGLSEES